MIQILEVIHESKFSNINLLSNTKFEVLGEGRHCQVVGWEET